MRAVDVDGTIYPCLRFAPLSLPAGTEPYRIGHTSTGICATIEERERYDALAAITRQSQSTRECIDCPIAEGCAWCTAYNYAIFGTPDKRATFICDMHKVRTLANAYYWNKRYRAEGSADRMPVNCPREWAVAIIPESEYDMLLALASSDA